jgi:hypothetical protein
MKKTVSGFIGLMCLIPIVAGAVTWQMDSNQFSWSGTSTKKTNALAASQNTLQCKVDVAGGTVTIRYTLASGAKGAKLRVYGISGAAVKGFDLKPGSGTMQWDIARENVPAGIYMACLPYGGVVKKTLIAIVK